MFRSLARTPFLNFEISNSDTLKGVLTESGFCYGVFLSDSLYFD
ncbi:hypothetical protein T4B_11604 [Trichinella pseudospiralis]|uniref:Uncharacterized protein n=1 Tax=Trichinella pseudospiralis TaxID=6337 RepID=A0A0V1GD22_TRIPS|nr:hypothetical protein T4B_11604 [Trichinella pseudospiralis]